MLTIYENIANFFFFFYFGPLFILQNYLGWKTHHLKAFTERIKTLFIHHFISNFLTVDKNLSILRFKMDVFFPLYQTVTL